MKLSVNADTNYEEYEAANNDEDANEGDADQGLPAPGALLRPPVLLGDAHRADSLQGIEDKEDQGVKDHSKSHIKQKQASLG